jgi:polyphosphate glucokinase
MVDPYVEEKILSVDIGGSRIKAILLDSGGQVIKEYTRMDTPKPADPERVMETIAELSKNFEDYRKVSVGFPGYVRKGVVYTAPNLGTDYWQNYPLSEKLRELLAHPVRIVNDADLQGLGIAQGVWNWAALIKPNTISIWACAISVLGPISRFCMTGGKPMGNVCGKC